MAAPIWIATKDCLGLPVSPFRSCCTCRFADFEGRKKIIDIIKEIRKKRKTVIIITQELEEYIDICNEIIVLDKGRVKHRSDVKKFLESENLGALEFSLPYHNQVLRILKSREWDVSVSIIDPVEAAKIIVNLNK